MDKKTISTMKKMFDDIMHITEDGTVESTGFYMVQ